MTLHLEIPDDLARDLAEQASKTGVRPEQVALAVLRRALDQDKLLAEALAPVHDAFKHSGMTEEELSDLLEEEKHAMRRGE